jgi:hypothetical protein
MLVSPLACQKQTWARPVVHLVVVDSVSVQSGAHAPDTRHDTSLLLMSLEGKNMNARTRLSREVSPTLTLPIFKRMIVATRHCATHPGSGARSDRMAPLAMCGLATWPR